MFYSKYKAKKTIIDGITFDSKSEAKRYQELKLLERGGQIKNLSLQPKAYFNGHIRRLVYYPARISNTDLQRITL